MSLDWIRWPKGNLLDWVQTLAAVVAAVATVFFTKQLVKNDNNRERRAIAEQEERKTDLWRPQFKRAIKGWLLHASARGNENSIYDTAKAVLLLESEAGVTLKEEYRNLYTETVNEKSVKPALTPERFEEWVDSQSKE